MTLRLDRLGRELTDPYCSDCGGPMGYTNVLLRGYDTKTGKRNKVKRWACLNPVGMVHAHDGYQSYEEWEREAIK